ncbi:putative heparan sulfate 2-O-sulfotransferase pipe-like isoform X1 [Penaeus vannamei]|uniref:Putative heparan sulfate 2-O-sulfotransferase pipe-like isoform X1 n=1 Tax=Penaeus vannamei TaxID=6689 RepID=A0A423T4D0_PENVA|nr:putative heparan sulfate 2-O-sulfotransferase pipe-like isoform X1 [Penaeus vannamei]
MVEGRPVKAMIDPIPAGSKAQRGKPACICSFPRPLRREDERRMFSLGRNLSDEYGRQLQIAPLEYHDDLQDWLNKPRLIVSRRGSAASPKQRFLTKKGGVKGSLARSQSLLRKFLAKGVSYRNWLLSTRASWLPPLVLPRLLKRLAVCVFIFIVIWVVLNGFFPSSADLAQKESVVVARGLSSDDALLNYDLEELQSPEGRYDLFRKIYGGEQAGGLPYRQLYRRPPPVQEPIPMMPLALPDGTAPEEVNGVPSDDVVLKYGDEAMKTIDGRYSLFKKIYGGSARRTGWFLNAKVYGDQPAHFGLPGQPVGVQGQPIGVPAQPVGVPGQPVGVPAQPVPVRYPGQNIGLQGQLPGQPAVVPGGAPAQPAVLPVQPGIPPGQPAGQPVQVPGNQALGAPGQPPGQAAGVPGQAAGVPGQVAGAPAQPRDPTNENGGLGENPFNKVPEGGAAQPAEDNQGEAATEDVVPSSRNVTMPETRLVIFSAVPKCGSATTAKLFKTLSSMNRFTAMVPQIRIQPRLAEQQREVLLKNLMTHALKVPVAYVRHLFYMDNIKLGFPQVSWVAIVRDPVERLISQFYYVRIESRYDAVKLLEGRKPSQEFFNMTLDECVPAKDTRCWYRKGTHQMLQLSFFCGQETFCQLVGDRKALQLAKYHAETRYSAVGLLEELPLSYKVFQHYLPLFFGKATTIEEGTGNMRLNGQDDKPTVSERTKNMMRSYLKEDLEFYQFLKQRLYLQAEAISKQQ